MPNVSEFERNKPRETYKAIVKAKEKMLQMCEEFRGLITVQNSKTFETILSCSAGAE